jgi:hypothetical protein
VGASAAHQALRHLSKDIAGIDHVALNEHWDVVMGAFENGLVGLWPGWVRHKTSSLRRIVMKMYIF